MIEPEDMSGSVATLQAERNDRWSQKIWREWAERHNRDNPDDPCPPGILQTASSPSELQPWLIRFINSFQDRDGASAAYKPNTLYSVLCYIQKHVRIFNPNHQNGSLKFLDRKNEGFKDFRDSLAIVNQHIETFGVERRHYDIFTADDEETMWSNSVLGTSSPIQLLHTLYYYNGKNLLLRRGEHQMLRFSQFKRFGSPERYEFERIQSEEVSSDQETETRHPPSPVPPPPPSGRKSNRRRVTCIRADPNAGLRCHVFLLDTYFSKIPPGALDKDLFYLHPLRSQSGSDQVWFTERPYGRHSLDKITKAIADRAGFSGHYTATSLQQTGRACSSSSITHHKFTKSLRTAEDVNGRKSKRQKLSPIEETENGALTNGDFEDDDEDEDDDDDDERPLLLPCEEEEEVYKRPLHYSEAPERGIKFLGDLQFHGTRVKVLSETRDSRTPSSFQEVSMGDCRVTISPSQPIGVDILRSALQSAGSDEGQWQVVLIPPKLRLQGGQEVLLEEPQSRDNAVNHHLGTHYISEDEGEGASYVHISSPRGSNSLPTGTTIFQYVNN